MTKIELDGEMYDVEDTFVCEFCEMVRPMMALAKAKYEGPPGSVPIACIDCYHRQPNSPEENIYG